MGVLDDAIRQHIELKRQHGASEQELERKQEEALGPARREAAAKSADGGESSSDATATASAEPGDPDETPFSEQETRIFSPGDDPVPVALDEPAADPLADPTAESVRQPRPIEPADDWLEPEPEPEPERDDDDRAPAAEDPADDSEDVLEETPDFLQETPEHDRLWFEQKPPRDFDFDDK